MQFIAGTYFCHRKCRRFCSGFHEINGIRKVERLDGPGSNSGRARKFSPKRPDRLRCPRCSLLNGYWGSFPSINWPRHEVKHNSLSSAEVKNERSYTSTPHTSLHVVDREDFLSFTLRMT
jgi:hypothetical protein